MDDKLSDKIKVNQAEFETKTAKLGEDVEIANKYADNEPTDTTDLAAEIATAEEMKKHLNEYKRMTAKQSEIGQMQEEADEFTRKIEIARELPGKYLKPATIPIDGLTVEDGIPLINGLPISNLSDGELLELCVNVSVSKPGQLQIILIDGAEKLDTANREKLYQKCREKRVAIYSNKSYRLGRIGGC